MSNREWKIEGCSLEHPYIAIKEEEQIVCLIGCVGNLEEKKSNATLIAAAPEMYKMLKDVVDVLAAHSDSQGKAVEIQKLLDWIDGKEI